MRTAERTSISNRLARGRVAVEPPGARSSQRRSAAVAVAVVVAVAVAVAVRLQGLDIIIIIDQAEYTVNVMIKY